MTTMEGCVMTIAKLLSSDSHIVEPPDLWLERIAAKFRDRAPRVVQEDDGDWWIVDGHRTNSFQGGTQAGKRFENQAALRPAGRFADVRPGAYVPDAHIADNEMDGVYGSVLYPTEGLQLFSVPDSGSYRPFFRSTTTGSPTFAAPIPSGSRASPCSTWTIFPVLCKNWSAPASAAWRAP